MMVVLMLGAWDSPAWWITSASVMNRQGQLQVSGWPMEPTETEIPGCLGQLAGWRSEKFQWTNSDIQWYPDPKFPKFEQCFYRQDTFLGFRAAARWLCLPVFDTAAWKATCKFPLQTWLTWQNLQPHWWVAGDCKPARSSYFQMMQLWLEPYVHCMLPYYSPGPAKMRQLFMSSEVDWTFPKSLLPTEQCLFYVDDSIIFSETAKTQYPPVQHCQFSSMIYLLN